MSEQDIFIGREKELQMIDEMIFDPTGANHFLPIFGAGGVGKTCLLRKIWHDYQDKSNLLVLKIDYAQSRAQSFPAIVRHFMSQLKDYIPQNYRQEFYRRMSDVERLANQNFSHEIIRAEEERVYQFGIDLISKFTKNQRIVILRDTAEALFPSIENIQRINSYFSKFPNTVIIVAFRPLEPLLKALSSLDSIYEGWRIDAPYELKPFSTSETVQYFEAALEGEMPSDLRDKIFLLTGGNPVLIAIAGEWLKRHIKLPLDVDSPLSELQALDEATLAQRRQRFEFALVDKVRSLRKPVDWATLYLAYLNRRYEPKILELALRPDLDLDDEQFHDVVEELKTLVFVRKSMSVEGGLLHDEAQRLIRKHAWPSVDPTRELQQELAKRVIEGYYLPEIEHLSQIVQAKLAQSLEHKLIAPERRRLPPIPDEDWLKRELQIECLDYHFRISAGKGWQYLNELFDEALNHHYSLIQMDAIIQAVHNLAPKQVDEARFKVRVAQTLLAKGEVSNAMIMARTVLNQPKLNRSDAAEALIVLGRATTNPTLKIKEFQAALENAQLAQDYILEAQALKLLGLAYRRQGRWPEAVKSYQQGLRLLDEEEEPDEYANTLNNLAFVTMLSGNPTRADTMAEKALRIRKAQGNLHGLSLSYATKGRIAGTLADYERAVRYHRLSVDLAESVGDDDNVALFQTNVAAAERYANNFNTARQLLASGLKSETDRVRVRALYEAAKIELEEARTETYQSPPEEVKSLYDKANKNAQQALELAKQISDKHLQASILFELTLIYYFKNKCEDKEHLEALRTILTDHDYTLEKGRMVELEGDFAYTKGDIFGAFQKYLEACNILAEYSLARFRENFERLRIKFFDQPSDIQTQICAMIKAKFSTVHSTSPLAALKELCLDDFADF